MSFGTHAANVNQCQSRSLLSRRESGDLLQKLSIQSKLTLILLAVSISSILTIAFVGYRSGKQALQNRIYNQLTSLRFTTSQEIERYFMQVRGEVKIMAENPAVIRAMKDFKSAYTELQQTPIEPQVGTSIDTYYREKFIPKLKPTVQGEPQADTYKPISPSQQYLQYHYTIKSDDFDQLAAINDPGDSSNYSKIHRNIHPFLRNFTEESQHEDLFLIDADTGEVIYSVFKGIDFTASLRNGYLQSSVLAEAFQKVLKTGTPKYVVLEDYQTYVPSYNDPAAIIASPIFDGGRLIGVLAIQVSSAPINKVMTHAQQWKDVGLGNSGETYLVGPDFLMRSDSRFLLETPEAYYNALTNYGVRQSTIDQIKRTESSILIQEVKTESVQRALAGKNGTHIIEDYRGIPVWSSYAPLQAVNELGIQWSVMAEIDESEAFAPIQKLQRQVFITTAGIILLITVIALVLAQMLVRPIRILQVGLAKVGEGKMDTTIDVKTKDEFHDLAESFNNMVKSLKSKTIMLNQKSQENEELLLSILPSPVAKRLKTGEDTIADSHANVTVLFADVVGFATLSETMEAEKSVTLLNQLVSGFDDALERYGVEKIKTIGSGYMAVGGLSVARLDHAKRVIDFGLDMIRVVQMFNTTHNTHLKVQIGVHVGPVVAGIVGKRKFIYDLWGDAVSIAHEMKTTCIPDTIHVSDAIYGQLKEFYDFSPHFENEGSDIANTWILKP